MNLIEKAKAFAYKAHAGQVRKYNGIPYITHPERVAFCVSKFTNHEDVIAAAWLHDVVEDCPIAIEDITKDFGIEVAIIVDDLTNPSKEFSFLKRKERKEIDRKWLAGASPDAQLIKVIDRIDNLREMEGCNDSFKELYAQESLLLADVLTQAPAELVDQLRNLAGKYIAYESHI